MIYTKNVNTDAELIDPRLENPSVYHSNESGAVVYFGAVKVYEMVDLGLPSGLKWARVNIGAETETENGMYFAYGDTEGFYLEDITSDMFNNGWYSNRPGKSVTTVNPDEGTDAARELWGGDWRLPTSNDCKELYNNTTQEVVTINGVKGTKFTSKVDSSKYIFLPYAGTVLNGENKYNGMYGMYYEATKSGLNASVFEVRYDGSLTYTALSACFYGHTARPVCM